MKYQIRRVTALLILTGVAAYLIATEAHRKILALIWPPVSDYLTYLFS